MSATQSIPTTTLAAGATTFDFIASTQPWNQAVVTINRTGNPSKDPWLNNLTPADSLTIDIQYSTDGGTTYNDLGPDTWFGGVVTVKGVTISTFEIGVGIGVPFPAGTLFRVITTATVPTTISGTVVYTTE